MNIQEPLFSALVLAGIGLLLTAAVSLSRASTKLGVPVALSFLLVGVLAGSEGIGGIPFENYRLTFQLGTAALVFILFDGGLNTSLTTVRRVAGPAAVLATIGVVGTAGLTAVAAHWLGVDWRMSLLLGAIVSSTDAAAVFSVLTASGIRLKERVESLLEVESGLNDPMAVILTTALTANLASTGPLNLWRLAGETVAEMVIGAVVGAAIGRAARWRLTRMRLPAPGLYPAFSLGVASLAYGVPTLLHGSGFLGVYLAGVVMGSKPFPQAASVRRVHDAIGWLSQVIMFLLLGLLVFPSRLFDVALIGLAVALVLALVARPLVVALCLAPFRLPAREIGYVGFVGLRGAVPIVLATIPVMSGVARSADLFDLVFFIVVIGAFLPGSAVPWASRRFGLIAEPEPAKSMIEVHPASGDLQLRRYFIEPTVAVIGAPLGEIPLPTGCAITAIERNGVMIAARADSVLEDGDEAHVLCRGEDAAHLALLFGPSTEA